MSIETDFRALLAGDAGVAALVADRVTQNVMRVGATPPFVVFSASHNATHNLEGVLVQDQCALTAECWAATSAAADQVADAVVAALAGAPGPAAVAVVGRQSGFDAEADLHATVLTVEWWSP